MHLNRSPEWQEVTPPSGWTWTLPFTIQKRGRKFRPDPTFSLQSRAGITVAKTYYLDTVNGSDAWPGTESQPKATWNAIIALTDYDRVIIKNGSYLYRGTSSSTPSRSVEVIGEGTVYFTSDRSNNLGAWSLAAGQTYTFQSTVSGSEFIARVDDESVLDAFGKPTRYTSKTSIADVEAQAGSFYWVGGVLYVHTLDGLTPSGRTDIKYYDSTAMTLTRDNLNIYFENINFRGGTTFRNNSSAGGLKVYLKSCTGFNLTVAGVSEFIAQSCSFSPSPPSGDVANYDDRNTLATSAIEIDCEFYNAGSTTSDQASTIHNNSRIVRINGKYHHVAGQVIAEGHSPCRSWMLGSEFYNSTSGIGYYTPGLAWLDCCWSHDNNTYDLQNPVGSTIYIRNFIGEKGVNNILGTLTTY